jgi:hypothetical protein
MAMSSTVPWSTALKDVLDGLEMAAADQQGDADDTTAEMVSDLKPHHRCCTVTTTIHAAWPFGG